MEFLLVALIVFFGTLTQSMIGFGVALVSMPLLIRLLDPATAAVLVALFVLPLQMIILWRYRHSLNIRPFWRVILSSIIGIPIGVTLLTQLDRSLILGMLGILLISYALYSLFKLRLPSFHNPAWEWGFGLVSGLLGGAYNTSGPPLVIYGTSLRWSPEEFKANLQALLMINSAIVIVAHGVAGHVTPLVLQNLVVALPMVFAGSATGFWLSRYVNEAVFYRIVLIMLVLVGFSLLLP